MISPEKIKEMDAITGFGNIPNPDAVNRVNEIKSWATPEPTFDERVAKNFGEFATGVAKSGVQTIQGLGQLGLKGVKVLTGKDFGTEETFFEDKTALEPKTTAEKVGKITGDIAQYFIPAGQAAKAEKFVDLISKGISSPLLAAGTRIVGKATVQGVSAGAVNLAQTGGDIKEAEKVAATAGIIRGGMAIIGEGARALHLPERLYSTIFKNSAKDMTTELKSGGLQTLRNNNPDKFQELVSKGIIKIGKNGDPILNDTLAEEALDKGLRGSIRGMANEVVEKTLESEDKARQIASGFKGKVDLSEPQFKKVLQGLAEEYQDVGFGEIADDATNLVSKIDDGAGKISATDALSIRRLLDKARIATSFDRPAMKLSLSQGNLKTLADAVRSRVNAIPEMGEIMKDYSFYLDAMESLAKEAARRGNNQVLSLIDSLFLSGAYAGNNPIPGLTMGMFRKIVQSAWGTTALGQILKNSNVSRLTSGLISAGSAGIQSPQINQ